MIKILSVVVIGVFLLMGSALHAEDCPNGYQWNGAACIPVSPSHDSPPEIDEPAEDENDIALPTTGDDASGDEGDEAADDETEY